MARIYRCAEKLIGRTPLMEAAHIEKEEGLKARLLLKLEGFNPGGSAKDRVGLKMIDDAQKRGVYFVLVDRMKSGKNVAETQKILYDVCNYQILLKKGVWAHGAFEAAYPERWKSEGNRCVKGRFVSESPDGCKALCRNR